MKKRVLLTGAGVRVGAAIARHLDLEGWEVAIHCRRSVTSAKRLSGELKNRSVVLPLDLEKEDAALLVSRAAKELGGLEAVIHGASLFERDELKTLKQNRFERHMRVHAYSVLRLIAGMQVLPKSRAVSRSVLLLGDGCSGWSISGNFLSYATSKLAMMQLPSLLAASLAPSLRLNALALGPTLPGSQDKPGTFAKLASHIPLGRTSEVEEVCEAVAFVLASPSLTGQVIYLSGGMHLPGAALAKG